MRPSQSRHVLAALRKVLKMNQTDFSEIADCSTSTIQAIELDRLKLSESLAIKIEIATGVSRRWLLANDLSVPPYSRERQPYSFQTYEAHQAQNHDLAQLGLDMLKRANLPGLLFSTYEVLRDGMMSAIKEGKQDLALYRLSQFLEAYRKEFTGEDRPYVPSYNDDTIRLIENDLKDTVGYIKLRNSPLPVIGEMQSELYAASATEHIQRH